MAIKYATLAHEVDGKVEYIYPKTHAEAVEFNDEYSMKNKIEKIDSDMNEIDKRITNIAKGIEYGSIGTKNDAELIDIRVPSHNIVSQDTTYESAGDAIRGQLNAIMELINSMQNDINDIKSKIG